MEMKSVKAVIYTIVIIAAAIFLPYFIGRVLVYIIPPDCSCTINYGILWLTGLMMSVVFALIIFIIWLIYKSIYNKISN